MLAPMKYKTFTWPNNPKTFEVELKQTLHSYKLPFSGFAVQNLGSQQRIFKGEGEFAGPDAYDSFRRLAAQFNQTAGWLEHPVWPPVKVHFAKLKLKQEPKQEYVSYSFEFWECPEQTGYTESTPPADKVKYISALSGDSLSTIASRYSKTLASLLSLNPQVSGTDSFAEGQIIRIS